MTKNFIILITIINPVTTMKSFGILAFFLTAAVLGHPLENKVGDECENEFNGYCYRFIRKPMKFLLAAEYCSFEYGAHLADILTKEENDYIKGKLGDDPVRDFWIGGQDYNGDGTYHWMTGNQMTFTDFATDKGLPFMIMNHTLGMSWDTVDKKFIAGRICKSKIV